MKKNLLKIVLVLAITVAGQGCVSRAQHNLAIANTLKGAGSACLDAWQKQEDRHALERDVLVNRMKVIEAEKAALLADRDDLMKRLYKIKK